MSFNEYIKLPVKKRKRFLELCREYQEALKVKK